MNIFKDLMYYLSLYKEEAKDLNDVSYNLKKNSFILRSENIALENKVKDRCNDLAISVFEDLQFFRNEMMEVIKNSQVDIDNIDRDMRDLKAMKYNLKETLDLTESLLNKCENDVGVKMNK